MQFGLCELIDEPIKRRMIDRVRCLLRPLGIRKQRTLRYVCATFICFVD
jgi:hypothetical protein